MVIRSIAALVCLFLANLLLAQQTVKIDYCGCEDEYGAVTPAPDGKYFRRCKGKLIESGQFNQGKKDGEWISYSTKGQVIRKFSYLDGRLHGRVELYYPDGTPKVSAQFVNGLPDSSWKYFTPKGKIWIEGMYRLGAPVGQWIIRDKKGVAPVCHYDYSTQQYVKEGDPSFMKNGSIVQNDNTHEYFILSYPRRPGQGFAAPLGGYAFASDIFVHLMEVPLDYWDTYANLKYRLHVDLSADHVAKYSVSPINNHMDEGIPVLPFIINTNRPAKLKAVEHQKSSKYLLDSKVAEALALLPPWVNKDAFQTDLYVPYFINEVFER